MINIELERYLDLISHILAYYLPVIIGTIAQIVFLIFPLDFKNWEDDFLRVITYISVQEFAATLIFIGIPLCFGIFSIGAYRAASILIIVFMAACLRAYKIIPLELCSFVSAPPSINKKPDFLEFNDLNRLRILSDISTADYQGKLQIQNIKERLARKRPDKAEAGDRK